MADVGYEMECAGDVGSGWVRIRGDFEELAHRDLGWVLHGPNGVLQSGQLEWSDDDDWYPPLDFDLPIGHYRIVISLVDEARVVSDSEFDIAGCVRVEAGCHAVTFTNPANNPAARVTWSPTGDDWVPPEDSSKGGEVVLQPGESRRVEILHMEISGDAYVPAEDPRPAWPNGGEFFGETIEQHCGATMTRGVIGCAGQGRGYVEAVFSPPGERGLRYRIIDRYADGAAASGRFGADGAVRVRLRAGAYLLRAYTKENVLPYDQTGFDIPPCVTATARCHAVRFANPSDETVAIDYRNDDASSTATLRLKWGKAKTVPVKSRTLTWRATAYEANDTWTVKPGSGSVRIERTCFSVGDGDDRDHLAATGAPTTWRVGLVGISGTVTGLACLVRPRRPRRR